MRRTVVLLMCMALAVSPAWGAPRQWADDFSTVTVYDSNSYYAPCYSGPAPKYTLLEALTGDIYAQRAYVGGGTFSHNTNSLNVFLPDTGRKEFALFGWYGIGTGCPGEPPPGTINETFTSPNICIYGAIRLNPWQCKLPAKGNGWNITGPDLKPGVANVDDDGNGVTDDWNETPAARATVVNNGFGNADGTGFQAGLDNAPGVAGVDDDGNGITDDVGETGWTGSDDSDDVQRQMRWMCMKANFATTSVIYLCMDAGSTADAFSLREIVGSPITNKLEWANEIVSWKYYRSDRKYNWVFCVADHSCYGAQMWHNADMANPAETLGPLMSTMHTGPQDCTIAMGFDTYGAPGTPTRGPVHFKRQMMFQGNSNFADTFWVMSGLPTQYYPSPSSDLDKDKDVDGFDFLTFSNCYNGSNKPPQAACANAQADLDKDGDVDGFDFLTFSNCYNGSNKKPQASCFPPNLTTCGS